MIGTCTSCGAIDVEVNDAGMCAGCAASDGNKENQVDKSQDNMSTDSDKTPDPDM